MTMPTMPIETMSSIMVIPRRRMTLSRLVAERPPSPDWAGWIPILKLGECPIPVHGIVIAEFRRLGTLRPFREYLGAKHQC